MENIAVHLESCLLLQHADARDDLSRIWPRAEHWNLHYPNTEILSMANGAKLYLGAIEGAMAAADGSNSDAVGVAVDCRGRECANDLVDRPGGVKHKAPTTAEYARQGVVHRFLCVNYHMKKRRCGQKWVVNDLDALMAEILYLMQLLAEGRTIQYHCISPLYPVHWFSLPWPSFSIARLPRPS